jgi:hypothetical protein
MAVKGSCNTRTASRATNTGYRYSRKATDHAEAYLGTIR